MTKHFEKDYGPDAPTFIDLFCGCGGASLGLMNAGWNNLCGIDIAKGALLTYQYNLGNAIRADIRHLPLREDLRPDLVWGSPPCQGFSRMNCRKHTPKYAKQRKLLLWFALAVEYLQPKIVGFENIPETKRSPEFHEMLRMLKFEIYMPYSVSWKILNFADFGVPQRRHRIILIGIKVDKVIGLVEMPLPPYSPLAPSSNVDLPRVPTQAQLLEYPLEASG
jgi:DNA (cytosine-5)-methyltransferase 1